MASQPKRAHLDPTPDTPEQTDHSSSEAESGSEDDSGNDTHSTDR